MHEFDSTNEMWTAFENNIKQTIDRYIPTKLSSKSNRYPFMTRDLRRLINKRDKYFYKARKSNNPQVKQHAKTLKALVQRSLIEAYWKYVQDIISDPEASNLQDHKPTKKFWSFMKGLRKDASGVSPLLDNGKYCSDPKEKADILNRQFQSVFTEDERTAVPNKGNSPVSSMPQIVIDHKGVEKLLDGLKPHKASGPDAIPARVLKEAAAEIVPVLH